MSAQPVCGGRVHDGPPIAGVLFDIGGVVTESPLHAIARYERDHDLERNVINRAIVAGGEEGAWSRLERGELTVEQFLGPFESDCRARGLVVDAARVMAYIAEARIPRPPMLEAIRRIRHAGLRLGALTNNWRRNEPTPLREHFDVFIESSVVGLRKPDARIYLLACRELAVEPARTVFLDDIGRNLKSARALGMTTIKVDEPEPALRALEAVLGIRLS